MVGRSTSLRRAVFARLSLLLLLLQLSLPQLLALLLHLLSVPLGLLHQNFKVFDLFLDQGTVLGRSDSKRLPQMNIDTSEF